MWLGHRGCSVLGVNLRDVRSRAAHQAELLTIRMEGFTFFPTLRPSPQTLQNMHLSW